MKKNNSKKGILILVLLLAIGFAAVTTALYINGTIRIGSNPKNFEENVIFKEGTVSGTAKCVDKSDAECDLSSSFTRSDDGKYINFQVKFKNIGEYYELSYDIINNSQYVAELSEMTCKIYDSQPGEVTEETKADYYGTETPVSDKYITVTNTFNKENNDDLILQPKDSIHGTLKTEMIRSYIGKPENTSNIEEIETYYVRCRVNANAAEHNPSASDSDDTVISD